LAIRGLPRSKRPTIATLAERPCVQQHTKLALVDRLGERRLVLREHGETDRREVLVRLTQKASDLLQNLSALHRGQLRTVGAAMVEALAAILETSTLASGKLAGAEARPLGPTLSQSFCARASVSYRACWEATC
jgi:DNA-binding MarR family transcriptional regulator